MVIDPFKLYVIDLVAVLLFLLLQDLLSRHVGPKNKKRLTYTLMIGGLCAVVLIFSNLIGWLCFAGGTLIKTLKEPSKEKAFFLYVLLFISYVIADNLSSDIIIHLFNLNETNSIVFYTWQVTALRILTFIILFICFALIIRLFLGSPLFKLFTGNENMRFSIHVSVTICLIILLINTVAKSYGIHLAYLGMTITLFSAITFFTALSLIIYFKARKKEQDLRLAMEQKSIYEHYVADLEENYNLLGAFKHDYQNMLLSLELYIEENDLKGLKDCFNKLKIKSDLELNTIPDYYKALTTISNKSVKSILLAKITKAKDLGIAVTLEVTKKCSFDSHEYEVIRILGILLDNAIEASSQTDQPIIRLFLLAESGSLEIHIHNSYNQDRPVDINRIFQQGYSTKEKNTGIGLYTVKKIVDNHPDMLLEVEKGSLFMVTLTILI